MSDIEQEIEDLHELIEHQAARCTRLQRATVLNLVEGNMNQVEAYVKAGGAAKSQRTRETSASEIMRNPESVAYRKLLERRVMLQSIMTKVEGAKILSDIARARMKDFIQCSFEQELDEETGELKTVVKYDITDFNDLPEHIHNAMQSVTLTSAGPRIELAKKDSAIKQLSKMLGWDAPKEVTTPKGKPLQVETNNHVTLKPEELDESIEKFKGFL